MSGEWAREPHAFATRDSPAWARVAASVLLSAPEGRVVVSVLLPLLPLVPLLGEDLLPLGGWPLLLVVVVAAVLIHRALAGLTARAGRLPGVVVEGRGRRGLVPVLLVLRGYETPEADALVARVLRERRAFTEAVRDGHSTSGSLLGAIGRESYASRVPDPGFRRDVLRAITPLPADAEWLSRRASATTLEVLYEERRGDLERFLADVDSGTPVEWAVRRLTRSAGGE